MENRQIEIHVGAHRLPGMLRLPDTAAPAPAVVFHNGYGAYREMYDEMAQRLCRAGYVTLEYDCRGSNQPTLGRFLCGTEWLEDLSACISYCTALPQVDAKRIGLAGVSMGGATIIAQGARDPRVRCLFAMAPVRTGRELIEETWIRNRGKAAWDAFWSHVLEDAGHVAMGQPSEQMPAEYACAGLDRPSEEELQARKLHPNKAVLLPLESVLNCWLYVDTQAAVRQVSVPLCIVHGTADETVPCTSSRLLFAEAASPHKALHLLPGAGHVLPEEACEQVSRLALDWFSRYL